MKSPWIFFLLSTFLIPIYIEKLILHTRGKKSFHLFCRHSAVLFNHIDGWRIEFWKNVDRDRSDRHHGKKEEWPGKIPRMVMGLLNAERTISMRLNWVIE